MQVNRRVVGRAKSHQEIYKIKDENSNSNIAEFKLSVKQKQVLQNLQFQMENCRWKIPFLTASDFAAFLTKLSAGTMVELVTSISVLLRNLILFMVVTIGSPKFVDYTQQQKSQQKNQKNDIEKLLEGVQQIQIIFLQLAILGTSLALIQFTSVAAKWPFSTVVVSSLSAVFMAFRLSMWVFPKISQICSQFINMILDPKDIKTDTVQSKEKQQKISLLVSSDTIPSKEKLDTVSSGEKQLKTSLLVSSNDTVSSKEKFDTISSEEKQQKISLLVSSDLSDTNEYEFSREQEIVILQLIDSMMASGHGLLLLSLADSLLILVNLLLRSPLEAVGIVGSLVDDILMAIFIVRASTRFKLIVGSTNHDIELLLEGLGEKQGITKLFKRIGKVAQGVGIGKFAEIAFKLVKPYF